MKTFALKILLLLVALSGMGFTQAKTHLNWKSNLEEAQKESEKTGKPIFLFFTGSDWCTWCKVLDKEVLSNPAFISEVKDQYIFVEIDFPKKKMMDKRIEAQNAALAKKYNVDSFPTIVVTNPKGVELGRTGYKKGGARLFADHLVGMVK